MPENVLSLTPEKIAELRSKKILSDYAEEVQLDAVGGLKVLGTLTDEEKAVFVEFVLIEADLEAFGKELSARSLEKFGETIREVDHPYELEAAIKDKSLFDNDEECEEFYYEIERAQFLKRYFWFSVKERLQTFASALSIRAGYNICFLAKKNGLR